MKKIIFSLKLKKNVVRLPVKKCEGLERGIGLMFKKREKADALLFEFKNKINISLTSLFVFFPFLAVWIDENKKIVDLKIIKPFTLLIKSKRDFSKILEIPINKKYDRIIKVLYSKLPPL